MRQRQASLINVVHLHHRPHWWRLPSCAGVVLAFVVYPFVVGNYYTYLVNLVLIASIGAIAMNVLTGYAGLISFGAAAFLAIGGYTTVIITISLQQSYWLALPLAIVVAAAIGVLVGLPSLRLRGLYMVLTTLALHYIVIYLADRYQRVQGHLGGFTISSPSLFFVRLSNPIPQYFLFLVAATAVLLYVINLRRTRVGRALLAIQEGEAAASMLGIHVAAYKLGAFALSSALLGLAGALQALSTGHVTVDNYSLLISVDYIAMFIIGGTGSILGSVLGAALVTLLPVGVEQALRAVPADTGILQMLSVHVFDLSAVLFGGLIVLFLELEPGGLVELWRRVVAVCLPAQSIPQDPGIRGQSDKEEVSLEHTLSLAPADALLAATNLTVAYSRGARAVQDATFFVRAGEIVALLGPNGAGKTSTLRAISGFLPAEPGHLTRGLVTFAGEPIAGSLPHETARRGIRLVPEREKVFASLTVAEHLELAASRNRHRLAAIDADFPQLRALWARRAGYLSGGERQLLALACAVLAETRLLLIDEMSLGLSPVALTHLLDIVQRLHRTRGLTVVLVEQNATAALTLATRGYVLETGRISAAGPASTLAVRVRELYLGQTEEGILNNDEQSFT